MSDRVLFISGRCEHCKKILIGIQQHSFLKPLFRVVNVDTQPYPNYVKSVPSILINNQVISGQTVFEYFGKLVEGKKAQEQRVQNNQTNSSDQGQCRINEEGELEGYCVNGGSGVEFSMISEENDDYTKRTYKIESSYDFLEGASGVSSFCERSPTFTPFSLAIISFSLFNKILPSAPEPYVTIISLVLNFLI